MAQLRVGACSVLIPWEELGGGEGDSSLKDAAWLDNFVAKYRMMCTPHATVYRMLILHFFDSTPSGLSSTKTKYAFRPSDSPRRKLSNLGTGVKHLKGEDLYLYMQCSSMREERGLVFGVRLSHSAAPPRDILFERRLLSSELERHLGGWKAEMGGVKAELQTGVISIINLMELGGVVLPAELERAVFEAAAVIDYKNISRLLLVAHRVHTWLKPFLSHVLVYRGADTPELFGTHVRHLMLDMRSPVTDITNILADCSAVHNLACYCTVDPSCLPALALMRPLRLHIRAVDLFAGGAPRFAHALFARTTHLQFLDYSLLAFDAASWASLATLPCLTHLAFSAYVAVPARAVHELLRESTRLRALVVICSAGAGAADWGTKYPTHDVRFVVAVVGDVVGDWVAGAWGHADFWARADDVIRLRRQDDARVDNMALPPPHPQHGPARGTRPAGQRQLARHPCPRRAADPSNTFSPTPPRPPARPPALTNALCSSAHPPRAALRIVWCAAVVEIV
ncbi:hypothetical protein C8J57DRAFT_1212758 [Mycena rebaudengoi]|nr:hypothetical protein C8J57DRAFT_1212758 [Mycena rebaudengoi]